MNANLYNLVQEGFLGNVTFKYKQKEVKEPIMKELMKRTDTKASRVVEACLEPWIHIRKNSVVGTT